MLKKIKKKISDTKKDKIIKTLENEVSALSVMNETLRNQNCEHLITIGQWQNKLYQLQSMYDALRIAQSNALEPMRNLLNQEIALFTEANTKWVNILKKMQDEIDWLKQFAAEVRAEHVLDDDRYIQICKRLDMLDNPLC